MTFPRMPPPDRFGPATAVGRFVLFSPVTADLAWSSLGFHAAYRGLQPCESATLCAEGPPRSAETHRRLSDFDCIFVSIAWELELIALVQSLRACGIEPDRSRRPASDPLLVAGGPLTLSNPEALGGLCDAVFVGEADAWFSEIRSAVAEATSRPDALERLSRLPGMFVPAIHGAESDAPAAVCASRDHLPAHSVKTGEPNVFGGAFLVEVGRGCPRGCTFCVVRCARRPARFVGPAQVLSCIPADSTRIGLVGAAVSDHPRLLQILDALVSDGRRVTLSSVRADRVTDDLASRLARGGLKTLTIAADGVSESVRAALRKGIRAEHLIQAAVTARSSGIRGLRLYLMIGAPTETDEDILEGARLVRDLAAILPVTVSVSPLVPKRFTPLEHEPFAGVPVLRRRLAALRKAIGGAARVAAVSPRVAELEWRLSRARGPEVLRLMDLRTR